MAVETFRDKLMNLINANSMENTSNTPDFILAEFLNGALALFDAGVNRRTKWYEGAAPDQSPARSGEVSSVPMEDSGIPAAVLDGNNPICVYISSHASSHQVTTAYDLIKKAEAKGYILRYGNTVADVNGGAVTFLLYVHISKTTVTEIKGNQGVIANV